MRIGGDLGRVLAICDVRRSGGKEGGRGDGISVPYLLRGGVDGLRMGRR